MPTDNSFNRPSSRPHLSALSGLRFFLALQLVFFHFAHPYVKNLPDWLRNIVTTGYFSTSTFFLLSGFILGYVYLNNEGLLKTSFRKFFISRIVKIYPLHIFCFLLVLPSLFWGRGIESGYGVEAAVLVKCIAFFSQLLLLDAWNPCFMAINVPAWSVSALVFFYCVFPTFARYIHTFKTSQLWLTVMILWGSYLIYPCLYIYFDLGRDYFYSGLLHRHPLIRLPEFLIGVTLCKIFLKDYKTFLVSGSGLRPLTGKITPLLAFVLVFLALAYLPDYVPYALLHNGLFTPVQAILILTLAFHSGRIPRLLGNKLFTRLGNATLVIFLSHGVIFSWWAKTEQLLIILSRNDLTILGDLQNLKKEFALFRENQFALSIPSFIACLLLVVITSVLLQERVVNPLSQKLNRMLEGISSGKEAKTHKSGSVQLPANA